MRRWLIVVLLGLVAAVWEVAVAPFLPGPLSLSPLWPLVVILLVSSKRSRAIVVAVCGGLVVDAYAASVIPWLTLRLLAGVLILDVVHQQFLTNRSLYATVALAVLARFIDVLGLFFLYLVRLGFSVHALWIAPSVWTWMWDVVLCAVGFLLIAAATRRYLPYGRSPDRMSAYGT
jgi:cell shape-determining protein MreD